MILLILMKYDYLFESFLFREKPAFLVLADITHINH